MNEIITIFTLPFMHRAILGGLLVALVSAWMGILITLRRSSLYGDAIAHVSITGVALGLLLHINPTLTTLVLSIAVALTLPYLKNKSRLPIDNLLGFILPFAMGFGVVLLAILPGYQPELLSYLFGSILTISWNDIGMIFGFSLIILLVLTFLYKKFILISLDEVQAKIRGLNVSQLELIYNILLAITIVLGIKVVGIILINALLVIPATIARVFSRSLRDLFIWTPLIAVILVLLGIATSVILDIPTGPTIAVVSGIMLLIAILIKH